MPRMLYEVCSRNILFDGANDIEDMRRDADYRYEGDDREKSLDLAQKYSDDVIEVVRNGISRDVYQWNALEVEGNEIVGCEIKIFDPLDRFKGIKKIAKRAHLFNVEMAKFTRRYDYDLISYIVGKRELIGNGACKRNDHWIDLYRYESLAFGDFTAYEVNGHLWLPEGFNDYGIMSPDELLLAMNEGARFWMDWQVDDPEMKLIYRVFKNRSL